MKPETQKTLHASRFTLHERGFTILEIIAATFVITLIVGGVYSLVVFNLRASGDVARHLEAAYLAQEGIEVVRNLRDANFLAIRKAQCNPINTPDCWKGVGTGSFADLTICDSPTGCEAQYNSISLAPYADTFLLQDGNGLYNYTTGTQALFKRKITIDDSASDLLKVDVEVLWDSQRVVASTELYNWLTLPPPVRSNGSPTGTLPAGTANAILSLTTNQNATCRYSTEQDRRFTETGFMLDFSPTGGTAHSINIFPLSNGQSYTYYIRCSGEFYNTNVTDFIITFDVANP